MSIFDRDNYRFNKQPDNHWLKQANKNKGFPQDDEFSLMQGDYGCANLDIFYSSQFVQGECQEGNGKEPLTYYILEHTPVLAGTMAGTIQLETPGTKPIQTFTVSSSGRFEFTAIGDSDVFAKTGELNLVTGEMRLNFNKSPGRHRIVVNYEYDMESQSSEQ